MRKINVAVVGVTGMVGSKFLEVLTERKLPVDTYYLYASAKSAGKEIDFMGKKHTVIELKEENIVDKKIDIALFSAGGETSKQFAPIFAKHGTLVIDNSNAWRRDKNVPLVVPECNSEDIRWHKNIIANPNCSTIQAVVALKPLHDAFEKRNQRRSAAEIPLSDLRKLYSAHRRFSGKRLHERRRQNDLRNEKNSRRLGS